MIQLPKSEQQYHQPPHPSSSHYPKLNNQYSYSEVPFSGGDINIKQEESMPNLPSLPSIASLLDNSRPQGSGQGQSDQGQDQSHGQGQGQGPSQDQSQSQGQSQLHNKSQNHNQTKTHNQPTQSPALNDQDQPAYPGYPPRQSPQNTHTASVPRKSPNSTPSTSSPAPSGDFHSMHQHQHHHQGYIVPPSGSQMSQVHGPQGVSQVPQGVSAVPHSHSQVQMAVAPPAHHHQMSSYVMPPGMGHPGAPPSSHPGHQPPQYMMDQQYWQKPQMYPMYPVMNGMQPMPPVMQYYPAASPYRQRGHSMGQEIKRRTKTGCLTCRRRRIKCDEQHPMCKNCSKSERICLGYDPILMSFSVDKNARLKQLQTKRRRFAQRQKYDKMRIISLVESTPVDAPHTWEQVVELFRSITPQLDELFETRQFSAIAQHVSQQLKHQGECKIVGELEVIRQLVAIVFSDRNFDALNVLDFPGANLEKLRTTNDYTLVRSLVEALTLADGSLHTAHVADERIHGKAMLMKQVIFAKEIRSPTPVSAGEILHSAMNAVNNPQQAWITISDLLTRGGQDVQVTAPVGPLGTLVIISAGEDAAQQLLLKDLDPFSRTLLELSLDPPQQA